MKIIYIEDNDKDFYLGHKIIKDKFDGVEIIQCRYLTDFLNSDKPYDMVITDLTLPDAYGPEVLKNIRALTGKPIIVLTGVGGTGLSDKIIQAVKQSGATIFLSKHNNGYKQLPDALSQFI